LDKANLGTRAFSAHIAPNGPRRFVIVALAIAACFSAVMLVMGQTPIVPSLFAASLLFHYWPAVSGEQAQIVMNRHGFWLDGYGQISWDAIARARLQTSELGGRVLNVLEIEPSEQTTRWQDKAKLVPFWRRFQARIWHFEDEASLAVVLSVLEDEPLQVVVAFEAFWGKPVTRSRDLIA
jgi:hypothetical protein